MKKALFFFFSTVLSFYISAQPFQISDLCDVLPETADITILNQGPDGYINVDVTNGEQLNGLYAGWCIDTDNAISLNTLYNADVYCSYETLPDGLVEFPENLDLVNWILNNVAVGQTSSCTGDDAGEYTYGDIQRAIWALIDDGQSTGGLGTWSQCRADEIEANARANGEGYEPGLDDFVGVIFDPSLPNGDPDTKYQTVLIPFLIVCDEECAECEGGVTSLDLVYLGVETATEIKVYEGDVKPDKLFATFDNVNPGEVISFVGPKSDNTMGSKIFLTIFPDDNKDDAVEIHTSCSQAIYVGFEKGDFLVAAGSSKDGGAFCDDYTSECDGGLTSLQLELIQAGLSNVTVTVYNGDVGDEVIISGEYSTGDIISFVGPEDNNEMDNDITLTINGDLTEIHTSCSDLIYVGIEFDDRYRVVGGTSKKGGPLPDCGECDDGVTSLDLEILADVSGATIRVYKDDVKSDKLFATFYNKGQGDVISFVGPASDNKMGSKIFLTINSTSKDDAVEIHTSCSQDIFVGSKYDNAYEVTAGFSKKGGPLCPIYVPGLCICDECDGGVTSLDLQIVADDIPTDATIRVYEGDVKSDKLFATFVNANKGDVISFVGPKSDNTMGSKIFLTINSTNEDDAIEIHTSCSQDIYAGMTFGNTYLVRGGTSKDGGRLCAVDVPDGEDCAECKGGVTAFDLELIKTGLSNVTVTVYNGDVGDDIIHEDYYSTGDIISFVGPESDGRMDNNIYLVIGNDEDNAVNIHTSCSQPVYIGIEFESTYRVVGGTSKDGGLFCDCNECDGGITSLELEILAVVTNATVTVYNGNVGDDVIISEVVSTGDVISFVGPEDDNRMDNNISLTFTINNVEGSPTEIHTSCSQDIYVGLSFDDRYLVTAGTSKKGGPLCEDPNKSSTVVTLHDLGDVAIYPNPVTHSGTVAFVAANDGQATIEIYDILGKQVAVLFDADVQAGTQYNVSFSTANLMKGMYIVIIQNESATYQQKLSVVR